ncbi:LLM class flavin-dependent oxidoreductase [Segnochrobactrum spirostomi]|uniref:LLM class flavin-dependent oxidoreductase n=1 Tax=Segnochrobactrum spirostomi TaxID=2608987 RepID=A0A6A7Y8G6_9HYPH|nr:LLM class flavin-dependent oxidoreductase [Segnochrobactrum spirostomi]MQT15166.1 LLM class flavin-dependent oxidoreductase [Segnochrobactrum spirostomi]
MAKEIRLNAFEMNCVAHQSPGLWRHPRDRSRDYRRLDYWTGLAKTLERGLFDGLFLADVLGVYDVYGGTPDAALRNATQIPVNDPLLLVPAMANVTRHLGFGVTATLSYEAPFPFARRMSTLDHLTEGRIGWNVVTGYLDSAARALGRTGQNAHDDRYAIADDYMEVVYKLWEGSWAEDAVVADAAHGVFTRPEGVRRVSHTSAHHRLDAIHLSEPSPQRTPVLYQAGTSPAGRAFAGRHAECVFMSGPSKTVIAPRVAAVRAAAAAAGRDPAEIRIFALMTVIVAPTDAEAAAKLAEYRHYASLEGALTLMSGWTGVDFAALDPDQIVEHVDREAGRSALENITRADPSRRWTVREVAEHVAIGGIGPVLVGSPATVADALEGWVDETGIDGFNLAFVVRPETFEDVADLLVPELQRRGRYKRAYAPGTLREKLFGAGRALTAPDHPAARHRWHLAPTDTAPAEPALPA